jgi:hypothetical protein
MSSTLDEQQYFRRPTIIIWREMSDMRVLAQATLRLVTHDSGC